MSWQNYCVSAPGIRPRRDKKLEEWKLELVPDSNPNYTSESSYSKHYHAITIYLNRNISPYNILY